MLSLKLLLSVGLVFVVVFTFIVVVIFLVQRDKKLRQRVRVREEELKRKLYELAILKELNDRAGYSLDIEKIVDVISGSLKQFIKYSTVSYMLIQPEKVIFKIDLAVSISQNFVNDVKRRMLNALSVLSGKELNYEQIDDVVVGAFITNEIEEPVKSFFNIPLVIDGVPVGLITVANTKEGLYKESEMTILYKIVNQASQAVTKLEQVVKAEQAKLNAMVTSMIDGVVMTSVDYRIIVANPSIQKILNIEGKDISIFKFIEVLGGIFDIRGKLEQAITTDSVLETEEIVINNRVFQVFVAPVKSSSEVIKNKILGGVVVFHDITHEREVEKMRTDFTSMMVHELRTPLDSIKKIGEMMNGDSIRNDKNVYDEYVGMIYESSSNMLELVNDLLDVSKLESGKFELSKRLFNIKQIVRERVKFFSISAKNAKVNLGGFLGSGVPEQLSFDPNRISQVLNNMLSNAIKFTDEGGSVTVQVLFHKKGSNIDAEMVRDHIKWFISDKNTKISELDNCVVIAVTDTGVGVTESDIAKLFNKFQQVGVGTKGDKGGTGLGLVILKGIVEAHGGVVGVVSKVGVGTTFYFTLKTEFVENTILPEK